MLEAVHESDAAASDTAQSACVGGEERSVREISRPLNVFKL